MKGEGGITSSYVRRGRGGGITKRTCACQGGRGDHFFTKNYVRTK